MSDEGAGCKSSLTLQQGRGCTAGAEPARKGRGCSDRLAAQGLQGRGYSSYRAGAAGLAGQLQTLRSRPG